MKKHFLRGLISLLVTFTFPTFTGASEAPVNISENMTLAEFIEGDDPDYPDSALRAGVEGWVKTRFTVKKDGSTDNIEIYQTSIDDYFDEAVITAVKSRVYKPATAFGEPVEEYNQTLLSIFTFPERTGGVSRPFMKTYSRAMDAIKANDLNTANRNIEKLESSKKRLLAEVCYLDMLKARYFEKKGDHEATLEHVDRALVIADVVATEDIQSFLLWQAVKYHALAKNYQTSLQYYEELVALDSNLSPEDPIHQIAATVKQLLSGDANIVTSGEISECSYCVPGTYFWNRTLNRNRFSINRVDGEVSKLVVWCQTGTVSLKFDPQMIWTVNKDWGECSLRVFGEEGTTLQLVEWPNKR